MWRRVAAIGVVAGLVGCAGRQTAAVRPAAPDAQFFAASSLHVSPVFTKIADFDGDNSPDGLEAVVELQDRFGDPTKAAGRLLFQVYRYQPYNPDPRGQRLAGPYEGRIDTAADQKARWSRVNRAYIFQLSFPQAALDQDYVLEATFESADGRRLFDRMTLEGDHTRPGPTTGPSPLNGATTGSTTAPAAAASTRGAITTQEYRSVPVTSQPHEPPPRADQP